MLQSDFRIQYDDSFIIEVNNQHYRFHDIRLNIPAHGLIEPMRSYLRGGEIRKGDVVVDAGAYIGMFTVMASRTVGENGRVVSFEPDPINYRELILNIELNGLQNVTPINKALWSCDTELPFNMKGELDSAIEIDGLDSDSHYKVQAVRLDAELRRLKVKDVGFVKMDIEGAEIEAIRGAEHLLMDDHPILAIATYHVIKGEQTYHNVEKLLRDMGYSVETTHSEHMITYAKM